MAQVTRDEAVALFNALGISSADKWNAKRMAAKLGKIEEMVDDDTNIEDVDIDKTLTTCLEAIEADEEIKVVSETKAAKDKDGKAEKGSPAEKKEKEAAKKKEAKEKEAAKKKEAAEAAKKKKEADATPGVRKTRTRPFLAGVLIKQHGVKAGVTDEMVTELNEMYGKVNDAESMFTLRNAWHAIRGFAKGVDPDAE